NVLGRAMVVAPGRQITAADIELEVPHSVEGEMLGSIRRAISAAFKSGKSNLVALLQGKLCQELLALTLSECDGDQEKAERMLGVSLAMLLADARKPDRGASPPKDTLFSFRTQAAQL